MASDHYRVSAETSLAVMDMENTAAMANMVVTVIMANMVRMDTTKKEKVQLQAQLRKQKQKV